MTEEYKRYLASRHWKQTRKEALAYHGRRCAVCGTTRRLQVHHLTYERLGHELMTDFKILCKAHHPKGAFSAGQIASWRHDLIFLRVLEWLLFLPFRLVWWLLRSGWRIASYSVRSVD